jgi:hypothetical protein
MSYIYIMSTPSTLALIIVLLFSSLSFPAMAQQADNEIKQSKNAAQPLVLVDGLKTDLKHLVVDPEKIMSIDVIKDSAALVKYGIEAKNGVVIVKFNPGITLMRIDHLYKKFNVGEEMTRMKVAVDGVPIKHPELLLIEEGVITGTGTYSHVDWTDLSNPKDEKFFNITTRLQKNTSRQ